MRPGTTRERVPSAGSSRGPPWHFSLEDFRRPEETLLTRSRGPGTGLLFAFRYLNALMQAAIEQPPGGTMGDWRSRAFGDTGLTVSALGFGGGHIGDPATPEPEVERLLNEVLDAGVTLIDTARGYGASEERIGRHLSGRRSEVVLSTKVGYGIPGYEDWTGPCVAAGVDEALRLMRTDRIDVVHLHSCPLEVLERGEVV